MQRLTPYLGIAIVIVVGVLFMAFSGSVTVLRPTEVSTSTPSPSFPAPPVLSIVPVSLPPIQTTAASTSSTKPASTPVEKAVSTASPVTKQTPALVPTAPPRAAQVVPPNADPALEASAVALRKAVVNIICYAPPLGTLRSISASGVIIDSRGIIVTDAHVAQYFLLADRGVSCVIRTGGPATPAYKASLMFISSAWVSANANVLGEPNPSGTGQYDFAFLAITGSATSTPLPTSFPYVPFSSEAPSIGTPVVIASYAAQYLAPSQILSALFPTVVFGSIKDLFTFAINSVDVFALGSSAAAQEGSSGGGVTDAQGQLVGVLTTSATNTTTGTRSLNAITTTYIELEYAAETGQSFYTLLSQSPAVNVANFAPQMPALEALVTKNLH